MFMYEKETEKNGIISSGAARTSSREENVLTTLTSHHSAELTVVKKVETYRTGMKPMWTFES